MRLQACLSLLALTLPAHALPFGGGDAASFLGASHWQPCYYINGSIPSLHDGALQLAATGSRTLKVSFEGASSFPWNSPLWPTTPWPSLLAIAQHPYYHALFSNALGTNFSTFVLVAYAQGPNAGGVCAPYTPTNAQEDTRQFAALTSHLIATYPTGLTFILQSWENDWAVRCGGYNGSKPADPAVQDRAIAWLQARQTGVTQGRAAAAAAAATPATPATTRVFHAAEVNLVASSMATGFPNNVLRVLPFVALDMVSYSSYDTMATPGFGAALDFIADHHNRTAASPSPALAVGEFGVGETYAPAGAAVGVVENVVAQALALGQGASNQGVRRAAYAAYWETIDNEVIGRSYSRCSTATGPVRDPAALAGFWLTRPDGTHGPVFEQLAGYINGSLPLPTPRPPTGACAFAADTDVTGVGGQSAPAGSQEACCAQCYAAGMARCGSAVFSAGQCYLKLPGGRQLRSPGRVTCTPAA